MAKKSNDNPRDGLTAPGETGKLDVVTRTDETTGRVLARIALNPQTRNANLAMSFASQMFGGQLKPDIVDCRAVLTEEIQHTTKGDLSLASRIFTSHAISLDALFTEMARRSGNNMGQYPDAADRYMRLALKAQAACRSTLEALSRQHQPREQAVRHVHVNEGAQAVIADQFHHHAGGSQNAEATKQPHATGTGATQGSPAMLGHDTQWNGLPSPCDQGSEAVPDARRQR